MKRNPWYFSYSVRDLLEEYDKKLFSVEGVELAEELLELTLETSPHILTQNEVDLISSYIKAEGDYSWDDVKSLYLVVGMRRVRGV